MNYCCTVVQREQTFVQRTAENEIFRRGQNTCETKLA